MLRVCVLTVLALYTFVPPGFCLCRLEAALFSAQHQDACPENHEDECECPTLKPDCQRSPAPEIGGADVSLALHVLEGESVPPQGSPATTVTFPSERSPGPPLFLTLRALLL